MPPLRSELADIHLTGLWLPQGLRIADITLTARDISFDPDSNDLQLPSGASAVASVSQADIASFLEKSAPLSDVQVRAEGGKLLISGTVRMIFEMRVAAVCTLRIHGGRQIFVDLESVDVLGVGAKNMVQAQIDKINPILDAHDLPFAIELETAAVDDGKVVVKGTASLA